MKRKAGIVCGAIVLLVFAGFGRGEGWDALLTGGLNLSRGNSDNTVATVGLGCSREEGRSAVRFGLEGSYGEAQAEDEEGVTIDELTAQNGKVLGEYKRKYDRVYGYAGAVLMHDRLADVDYRLVAGPGVGYAFYETDAASLSAELGVGYVWEDVADIADDYPAFRIAEQYGLEFGAARLWQKAEYVPKSEDFSDFLSSAEIGVEAMMSRRLSLRLVIQDKYDSEPAAGQEKNDFSIISALTWWLSRPMQ